MLIVQKYGGTSVGSIEKLRLVAKRALATQRAGNDVAVVVSAMSGETNRLLALSSEFRDGVDDREVDVIVSTGEQVTAGLLSLAIRKTGGDAKSFLGHQVKILTDSAHAKARIQSIDAAPLKGCFEEGKIAVIAGFQGQDSTGSITTLGRGGSDTTGVAIAAALGADHCEIYTDVDGIYTADPRIVPNARKIARISYEEMLDLASLGARVLQLRAVEFGMNYNVPIHVRSTFSDTEGTWVTHIKEDMEQVVVSGIAAVRDEAKITVRRVPDSPGSAYRLFQSLSDAGIVVDMIIQSQSKDGLTDMSFTVSKLDHKRCIEVLTESCSDLTAAGKAVVSDTPVAKLSVVGVGMRSHSGVAGKMFGILAEAGINLQLISTSEIKISVVVREDVVDDAIRALHEGFGLHLPVEA
ncbi:MAG: aspartate kinase [Myxococcales bacterium]|nr:aspartate kinase [Myxococcales bacterium]